MPNNPEDIPSEARPCPIWCWQGLLGFGVMGAWTLYLASDASYSFRNTPSGLLMHFFVMALSVLFGWFEFRKLFQDRDTTPGLMLSIVIIGGVLLVTYYYLQSYGLPVDDCCHGV